MIYVKTSQSTITAYVKYGRYTNLYTFMHAIDVALKRVGFGDRFELTGKVAEVKGSPIENEREIPVWVGDTFVAPKPEEPPYLKMKHDTDIAITFCKEIAYLLGVIPTFTSPVPAIKGGWKVEQSKIDLSRNNLTLLWVFADFIAPTCANKLLPIIRMVPIQAQ